MSCKQETRDIDGKECFCTQWPASKALTMKFKLMKVLGASIAEIASAIKGEDEKQIQALAEGISRLFDHNTPEEITELMISVINGVSVDGTKVVNQSLFDTVFQNDILFIYKVFIFVLQVNYGDFIRGQLAEKLLAKVNQS